MDSQQPARTPATCWRKTAYRRRSQMPDAMKRALANNMLEIDGRLHQGGGKSAKIVTKPAVARRARPSAERAPSVQAPQALKRLRAILVSPGTRFASRFPIRRAQRRISLLPQAPAHAQSYGETSVRFWPRCASILSKPPKRCDHEVFPAMHAATARRQARGRWLVPTCAGRWGALASA